jgi:diguanylate cyclase (GGDEF)-like protein
MPTLDAVSIAVFLCLVASVLAAGMTLLWRWEGSRHGFGYWVAAMWTLAAGILFLVARIALPLWMSALLGNGALLATTVLLRAGIQCYRGRPIRVGLDIALAGAAVLGLMLMLLAGAHIDSRIALASAAPAILMTRVTLSLSSPPPSRRTAYRAAQTVTATAALLTAIRALFAIFDFGTSTSLFDNGAYQGLIFMVLALLTILLPFVLVMLNSVRAVDQLRQAQASAETAAATDYLTGLANRRRMFGELSRLSPDTPIALCVLDLDDFKRINDRHGHACGDRVLAELGTLLQEGAHPDRMAVRLGGEEFALLARREPLEQIRQLAERVRASVEQRLATATGVGEHLTCSIGIAHGRAGDIDAVLGRADAALYDAKRGGKNRVSVVADAAGPEDLPKVPKHVDFRTHAR